MNRRGFLQSCLALAAAPAIVRAENIMRIWTPPQEIITVNEFGKVTTQHIEFWGAQIEHAVAPSYIQSQNFIGSVWIKNADGGWAREIIEMKATTPGVMPVMRVDQNGLSVQSGGELVSKRILPVGGDIPEQTAKVTFPNAQAHLTIGDPRGICFHQARVEIQPPKNWPRGEELRYPLRDNFEPTLHPAVKKLLERL